MRLTFVDEERRTAEDLEQFDGRAYDAVQPRGAIGAVEAVATARDHLAHAPAYIRKRDAHAPAGSPLGMGEAQQMARLKQLEHERFDRSGRADHAAHGQAARRVSR